MAQPFRMIEPVFIPMADGVRLAARLWLPDDAERKPVPAILEYIPYRTRDGTRARDEAMHGWFAENGYAALRVDIRGSGDSEGLLDDEYTEIEQADACTVIAWVAAQPWCDGTVGMMGISWGGFAALQVAARRPPALKAIITVCSTDDRYADDIHFMGGCLLNDKLWWGAMMMAWQALPPTPSVHPTSWRSMWQARLDALPFLPAKWLRHQRRDATWRKGSVCEDWPAITVPVLAVGGWADGYSNAVPRLLENLSGPRLGIIGPWAHHYPHFGVPGPAIGFLQEAKRWWDRWLRDEDNGIMGEPMLRTHMVDGGVERAPCADTPGRWVGEASWPSRLITRRPLFLSPGQLWWRPGPSADLAVRSPLWCGVTAGDWMASAGPGEGAGDQRIDDGMSLVFDSKELADRLENLGAPELVLEVASDRPSAQLCVRLCDVAPDGSSSRVTWQILNLSHRHGHETPSALEPGTFELIRLKLCDCAHSFPAGHRIRLAIATAAWPTVWPASDVATLTVRTGDSALVMPVRRPRREDAAIVFEAPAATRDTPVTPLAELHAERELALDLLSGTVRLTVDGNPFGASPQRFDEIATDVAHRLRRELSIRGEDPASARQAISQTVHLACDGHRFRIEAEAAMTATRTHFQVTATVTAFEDERLFATRSFEETIARDFV
jgi:putative CocE/NonD family hydrolase